MADDSQNIQLKVIARSSRLSLIQVEEVFSQFPGVDYVLQAVESFGDKNKQISLLGNISSDFFTRELDEALLNGKSDIAVHSAKDLPYPLPAGLEVISLFAAFDQTDSLVSRNHIKLADLPAGSRIGTSSKVRKEELLKLRPDLEVGSIRGTIEERNAQVDNGSFDAVIVATCALKRLNLADRITEILPFKTHPLQGNLAIVGKRGSSELKNLFKEKDIRRSYGKVTLVGFGPGNPDLLTIGGDKALQKADIIFHDDLLDKEFIGKYSAEKIYVGKRKDAHSFHQDDINELIYKAAISGKNVVRLKGGDPMVFAHGREEIDYLQSRFVEVDVIPGISSGIALASYTHIPLTHRGLSSSVAFVTGHSANRLQTPVADTLVYYMGGSNIASIAKKLISEQWDEKTPVALVNNVSLPNQKTFYSTLAELQFSIIKYPTPIIIIIGKVVSLEYAAEQNVLITGTSAADYKQEGKILHTPLIKIEKVKKTETIYNSLGNIGNYDWIVFTSRYGVRYFFEYLKELKTDIRQLSEIRIASVGKTTTSELNKHNIYPDTESETSSAEGLIAYFKRENISNKKILLPRSEIGLKQLSDELQKIGNRVTDLAVYQNKINEKPEKVNIGKFRKIVFSSPSGVDAFETIYGKLPEGIQLVAKGKTTENALRKKVE